MQSLSESGTLAIANGEYTRAHLFAWLISAVSGATEGNLHAILLLCIPIGSLLVLTIFLDLRKLAGKSEAIVAASMLALMPEAIFLSQFVRFYSLHALLFWIAAMMIYRATATGPISKARAVAYAFVSALALVVALHLQVTTLIGTLGMALWVGAISIPGAWGWLGKQAFATKLLLVVSVGTAITADIWFFAGYLGSLMEAYQTGPLWAENNRPGYYFHLYRDQFGAFWALFPVAVVVGLAVQPRLTLFCASIFVVSFVVHSFAAMREERFLFYAMPFFVTIWAIAACEIVRRAVAHCAIVFEGSRLKNLDAGRRKSLAVALVACLVTGVVAATPATEITARMVLNKPSYKLRYWHNQVTSWRLAQTTIAKLVATSDVFLTSQGLHALYYIGAYDAEISATALSDYSDPRLGSGIDPRTGRRNIANVESLHNFLSCYSSGVIVVNFNFWRRPHGVTDAVADFLEDKLMRVETPTEWGFHIFRWNHGEPGPGWTTTNTNPVGRNCQ